MARIVAKRNFRDGYCPEEKHGKVVLMPNVRVMPKKRQSALYESCIEILDGIGLDPKDITAKGIAEGCLYLALMWFMLAVLGA